MGFTLFDFFVFCEGVEPKSVGPIIDEDTIGKNPEWETSGTRSQETNMLLRVKHCLQRHIESTSRNELKRRFSYFLATFRATIGSVSQQTLRTAVYS